ncbi:uncharacterized protein LY89DRAFT_685090 [Mollisia scopiformis]|uniref:Uncharacterized protein n=1 Tax=Mollisia scopiformis TaxID=149040 RepID=A0A194XAF6_MOLSC|nr:uncharacterized protein LY89DRAFT_685090 [Mollisia scopiformis]KUJ17150.1 hypothetical protein LY89DRAFT_685090 [Mollisia scopiformis]
MSPPIHFLNTVQGQQEASDKFSILTPPRTDIFASPTHGYHFSAPIIYTQLPILEFGSAKATISIPFTLHSPKEKEVENPTLQFDQGGLVFVFPGAGTEAKDLVQAEKETHPRWIKAGIEVWEGKAWGSIVVREKWSDWSLFEPGQITATGTYKMTLEMERFGDALMIYTVSEVKKRTLVRKVPWVFLEEERSGVETIMIGVYGARPDPFNEAKGKLLEIGIKSFGVKDQDGKRII